MIPDPQDMNSGQWTIDGRGLHPFSLAERGPLGGGGGGGQEQVLQDPVNGLQ